MLMYKYYMEKEKYFEKIFNCFEENNIDQCVNLFDNFFSSFKYKNFNNFIIEINNYLIINQNINPKYGYLYCLYNEIFKFYGENVRKLGKAKDLNKRKNGYMTCYLKPSNMEIVTKQLKNYHIGERLLFIFLKKYRLLNNREFFNCPLPIIQETFKQIEQIFEENTIDKIIEKWLPNYFRTKFIKMKNYFYQLSKNENFIILLEKFNIKNLDNKNNINKILKIKSVKIINKNKIVKFFKMEQNCETSIFFERNIFEGFAKSMLLYYTDKTINDKNLQEYNFLSKYMNEDKDILKRFQLIKNIEEQLKINRFDINNINLSNEEIKKFIAKLKSNSNIIYYYNHKNASKKKLFRQALKKIDKFNSNDRIKKFLVDIYNIFDNLFTYEGKTKHFRMNKKNEWKRKQFVKNKNISDTIYYNFQKNNDLLLNHLNYINLLNISKNKLKIELFENQSI